MIWVWMGTESRADQARIPDFSAIMSSDRITSVSGYLNIKAAATLISDNLLDLSHAEFLHPFLTNPGFNGRTAQRVSKEKDSVLSVYALTNEPFTPLLAQLWDGPVIPAADMRFQMLWNPPSYLMLEIGATIPGHGRADGITAWASHLLTPETETSTHYFWAFARDSKLEDEALDEQLRSNISRAFMAEDAPIIEWQQRYEELSVEQKVWGPVLPGDAGGAQARRVMERLLQSERGLAGSEP